MSKAIRIVEPQPERAKEAMPDGVIDFRDNRWIQLGTAEMDQELATAHNELTDRIEALEKRISELEST